VNKEPKIMNTKRLQVLVGLFLIAMLLAACGGGQAAVGSTDSSSAATGSPDGKLAAKIDDYLTKQTKGVNKFSGAVLVARGDDIILSQGYGLADRKAEIPITTDTPFHILGLSDTFTALAIMQLQEQGKLRVEDSICNYLDICPAAWEPITIHQLLTHTSGLVWVPESFMSSYKPEGTPTPPQDIVQMGSSEALLFEPGSGHSYSLLGYTLLGLIVEQVSGQAYGEFLQSHVFDPLGMAQTGYGPDPEGMPNGYTTQTNESVRVDWSSPFPGGLFSTVEDLYRWSRALMDAKLVSEESMQQMFAHHLTPDHVVLDGISEISQMKDSNVGYGWQVGEFLDVPVLASHQDYFGFGEEMLLFPDQDVTAIILTNQEYNDIHMFMEPIAKWTLENE
jgi:CubicO group peptidase (beta-lactamase class C family)